MSENGTLKEICSLLTSATRSGVLRWRAGVIGQIIEARLDNTLFIINADSPTQQLSTWLISLTVFKQEGTQLKQVFSATLDSGDPIQRQEADLLIEVWKLAVPNAAGGAAERLEPVMESLRTAIRAAQH